MSIKSILAKLVHYPSITPKDAGCQDYMIEILSQLGFQCQRLNNGSVNNFYAQIGDKSPLLVFAGHTDVVPVGDATKWKTDPFTLTEQDGMFYGRGVADMKGSLACMLVAAQQFLEQYPQCSGSLGFLITSGEEGDDYDLGTPYVMAQLQAQNIHPDYCIVGEPSSSERVGDVVKIGRRGSLTGECIFHGKQGHVAYPHLAENPIHTLAPALNELTAMQWDEGNTHFPPTTLQVTHIQAGGQANNIIPGELILNFNLRYSTEQTANGLKQAIQACFTRHHLKPIVNWRLSGEPFLTAQGRLLDSCFDIITKHTKQKPILSTSGGTSDGRFIAPYGVEVIELGPVNATIHQVNECVAVDDLNQLATLYFLICEALIQ